MSRRLPPLRRPQTIGGVLYFAVVALTAVGLVVVAVGSWRRGVTFIGAGLLLAALARALLGEYDAGMLRVRRRWFDVLVLVVTGFTLVFLAATNPNQPGQ
ncbi:MAG: DUF3017 domain-containing protein [Actinomycetota bacterium]|nr:DUF3017 domain-containing protein [Actinomycetota bacterium]